MIKRFRVRAFTFVRRIPRRKEIVSIATTEWRVAILKGVLVLLGEEIFMLNGVVYTNDNLVRER